MALHVHSLQDVLSVGGDVLARICRSCLRVVCKDCGRLVFWPDNDAKVRELEEDADKQLFCRCRPYTKKFAHRKPTKRDAF
jgi:RNase P subunit RPR2